MATLDELRSALRQEILPYQARSLTEAEYNAGFDIVSRHSTSYPFFIYPQLTKALTPVLHRCLGPSVMEIGPGPKSVLESLPCELRRKIRQYVAFEPNATYVSSLKERISRKATNRHPTELDEDEGSCFQGLDGPPMIHQRNFALCDEKQLKANDKLAGKFDVILFCHSMYGMRPKRAYIKQAIKLLNDGGIVIVVHREGTVDFDGLVCHDRVADYTSTIHLKNTDEILDPFAYFVAGCKLEEVELDEAIRERWRAICRAKTRTDLTEVNYAEFLTPTVVVTFNQHAGKLSELLDKVSVAAGVRKLKSPEARDRRPAAIVTPTEIRHVQECVWWAQKYGLNLTVLGGSHSAQCLQDHVVAVDMSAFNELHIVEESGQEGCNKIEHLIVAGTGCTSGDIIHKAKERDLTVPLGARPSVGAGLWLQGGIGHLSRMHGLTCDSIIGAVLVDVREGHLLYVGNVPEQLLPPGAERATEEEELLWGLKGAGTNFAIVITVVFRAIKAPTHAVRTWILSSSNRDEIASRLRSLDEISRTLRTECSLDAFLYHQNDQLHLGTTLFTGLVASDVYEQVDNFRTVSNVFGPPITDNTVDSVGLFEADMYVSGMHGGHGGGKTSSFKRCILLDDVAAFSILGIFLHALENRPSNLCYMHLLHGGKAIAGVSTASTAFGCRNWQYACVITGVWSREQDRSDSARRVVDWVYDVARKLLPLGCGAYGADLGSDARDAPLAVEAFGRNRMRLARLKYRLDPENILAHACPLLKPLKEPKLILLVTGDACVGKDYCADVWTDLLNWKGVGVTKRSISDVAKEQYAKATGTDLKLLYTDRAFKEKHRPALTQFFRQQRQQRPWLPEEHFLHLVHGSGETDVLIITGMRDEAPVTAFSHLVPHSRVLDVRVSASEDIRRARGGAPGVGVEIADGRVDKSASPDYLPSHVFNNDAAEKASAERFFDIYILPFFHHDLEQLSGMVRTVSDFPASGVEFRHVLDIAQQRGGLPFCAALLQKHFVGDWSQIDAIACCESGGFVFGSALAARVDVPLALIREAGKLPPPCISALKSASHISALDPKGPQEKSIEMGRDVIRAGGSVVVVDDVFATGKTVCAVLKLLQRVWVRPENVTLIVVAEFPVHRGREYLRQNGFGAVRVQSLLVMGDR